MVKKVNFQNKCKLRIMKKKLNIAVVGLGQIGIYLLNELNTKKKI